jgi:hypothetical protein
MSQLDTYIENMQKKISKAQMDDTADILANNELVRKLSSSDIKQMIKKVKELMIDPIDDTDDIEVEYNNVEKNGEDNIINSEEKQIKSNIGNIMNKTCVEISPENLSKECYNSYITESGKYKNVKSISLKEYTLPQPNNNISEKNKLLILSGKTYELEEGMYTIIDLIDKIQKKIGNNLSIKMNSFDNIVIKSINGDKVVIDNNKETVTRYLGFTKEKYEGKTSYKSENKHNIKVINEIYLFFDNIIDSAFAKLYFDKNENRTEVFANFYNKPIPIIENLEIRFKISDDPKKNDLYDFEGKSHKLLVEFCSD